MSSNSLRGTQLFRYGSVIPAESSTSSRDNSERGEYRKPMGNKVSKVPEENAYTHLDKEEDTHKFWAQVHLFKYLPKEFHPQLTTASENVVFANDEVIMREGDAGNEFFVIKSGVAQVSVEGKDVAILKAGDYFGEGSLLRDDPRAATITVLSKIEALKITRENFRKLGLHEKLAFPKPQKINKRHRMMATNGGTNVSGALADEESVQIRNIRSMATDETTGKSVLAKPNYFKVQYDGLREIFCEPLNASAFILVPISQGVLYMKCSPAVIFGANFFAIVPLASILGGATEALSEHTGQLLGGLLNATFGNAVELIMCIQAVKAGLISVVQGNLLGSVLSNLLLVLGMAIIASGMQRKVQEFNAHGAAANMRCQLVASISVCLPTVFACIQNHGEEEVLEMSRMISLFLMIVYGLFLVFMLKTHAEFFAEESNEDVDQEEGLSALVSVVLLGIVTILVFLCSECLVSSIESVSEKYELSKAFIGIILLPIVGNAAEHTTAVTCAYKGMMDLALGVAVGSATQISLFVVPVAVFAGWMFEQPMNLNFTVFGSTCLMLTVFLVSHVLAHGETNWLDGAMLIAIYCSIAVQTLYIKEED